MAKDVPPFSPAANSLIADINKYVGRIDSYKESIVALKSKPIKEKILHFDGTLSVIEGLGSKAIRENSPSSSIDNLVEALHESKKEHLKLTTDQVDIDKINLNVAKTEAALKGFVLPLSLGGPSSDLKFVGLADDELLVPMQATKEAIIALSGQNIPREDYADEVIKKTNEILKADPRGFTAEKLEQYSNLVSQGKQVKKPSKLTLVELEAVSSAVAQSVSGLISSVTKDSQVAAATLLVSEVIKQMEEEQKVKFTPEIVEKITKALAPTLAKLGPEYLETHKGELTTGLVASLKSEQGYSTSFTGSYTVSTSSLDKMAKNIGKQHQPEADKGSVEKVNDVMYKGQMTNGDIAVKLNSFAEKTGMTKDGKPLTFDAKTIPDNSAIAKMRQSNPKQFDSIFNAPKSPSQPTPVVEKAKPVVKEVPVEVIVPKKPEKLPEGPAHAPLSAPPSLVTPPLITPIQPSPPKLQSVSVAAPQKVSVDSPQIDLAKEIIKSAIKAEGHKITPERVEKITKALAPTLARLGPEYLEQNKGDLAKELTTSLKAGQGYSTSFTGSYTVSTEELGKIAAKMEKQHQPKAQVASVEKVKDMVWKNVMKDGDVVAKLNSFVKQEGVTQNGKPLEAFNTKNVPNNETIAKIRLVNSKEFDKIFNAPPKLSPNLAQQASSVGHSHNLPHPPPGRGGQTTKPLLPPPSRPQSKGTKDVGGRS